MNRLVIGVAVASMAAISYVAISAGAPDRPAGVSAKEWIPISDSLGIVMVPREPTAIMGRVDPDKRTMQLPPAGMPLLLKPPVDGYFMVKGLGGWTRLVVVEPMKGPADVG